MYLLTTYSDYQDLCVIVIPCILLYSRLPSTASIYHSFTIVGFLIITLSLIFYKWMQFDKKVTISELYDDQKLPFSKGFFNAWDWSINKKHRCLNELKQTARSTKLNVEE